MDQVSAEWVALRARLESLIKSRALSVRETATELGISHGALNKILSGATAEPFKSTQRKIRTWVDHWEQAEGDQTDWDPTSSDLIHPGREALGSNIDDKEAARNLVVDPNLARRLVGQIGPEDVKTRLAIIYVFERVFLENGIQPKDWPGWLDELRQEVLQGE